MGASGMAGGRRLGIVLAAAALVLGAVVVTRRVRQPPAIEPPKPGNPRIVSLVPDATDDLVAIGCKDNLVAVSNFDSGPETASLPRVGDYLTTDWETIASLHPHWIVTHFGAGRTPAGFLERAASLGIAQLNLQTQTLEGADEKTTIFYAIRELGRIAGEEAKAVSAIKTLRARLDATRERTARQPRVRALIVIGGEGQTMLAGSGTFLDELLQIAGGENAAAGLAGDYPSVDREQLIALAPTVIIQLLPSASPQALRQAKAQWEAIPQLPAVKSGRVVQLTQGYVLLPSDHVGDLADDMASALHPAQ